MNQNKKIIISIGVIFSAILLSISLLKISINILYPGNELSNSLKESFKDIFGKAIKFDTLHFKYNGDIVLQNFYLSNTNDFNDNINLIKCQEITIDTYLFDLIRGKITFAGVYMVEPEVTILKNYGKSYYETFIEDIIGDINEDKIKQFITNGFRFELTDSALSFKETFRNSKSGLDIYNFDLKIKYKRDYISYRSYGYIRDKVRDSWFKSSYKINGKIFLNKEYSDTDIELENFDLAHLNSILNDRFTLRTLITGSLSGKVNLIINDDILKCKGNADSSALNFFYYDKETPYPFMKDENIDTEFSFTLSSDLDKIMIEKFEIDDGTIELSSSFDYVRDEFFSINLRTNKIDLNDLSDSVFLFKNCSYNGNLSVNGTCKYNFKNNKPEDLNFNLILNKFNIIPVEKNSYDLSNIRNGNMFITAVKDKIQINTYFNTENSDFNISLNSAISSWYPVKTSNKIEIVSKQVEVDVLKEIVENTIKKVYNLAFVDMFQNFDEQRNFLKEPEGIFINDNDVFLKLYSEKLIVAGKSYLNSLNIDLSLLKGIVKTNNFSLQGYGGIYTFDLYSNLHQDYPFFKFKTEVKDLNLNQISDDSKLGYSFGGKLALDMNYETSAYRIGQVVENGKAGFNVSVKDGFISNTPIQNQLNDFLTRNNYKEIINTRIDFQTFSMSFLQSANNFYIRNFSMSAPEMSFNSYGSYSVEEGLKVSMELNVKNKDITNRVPLELTGNLEAPCVKLKINKNESVCF